MSPVSLGLSAARSNELDDIMARIESGDYGSQHEKKELAHWINSCRPEVAQEIDAFLSPEGNAVGIVTLPDIANTRSTLRATELYLSQVFQWAREHRQARRILLVLEEAHTIVPESNLFPYDKADTLAAVGRLGQIALQGRKYGVGILLISQRTALVSKTLLSQCNTVISFSLVDKTSLDYLQNVFSGEHVHVIPHLPPLRALAFGKGIKSAHPLLIDIPFDQEKRDASEALAVTLPVSGDGSPAVASDDVAPVEDDLPF